jgi:hypothetical protein
MKEPPVSEKPRLLWHSNAPFTATGYGAQTALFAKRLVEHYDLSISAFWGLEGAVIPWNGIAVLPGMNGTYGNETIAEHVAATFGEPRNGLVLTLMDVWVLDPALWSQFNVASWVPVDHEPAPKPVRAFFEGSGSVPIAMSKFGQKMLEDFDPLYVPHGVDTKASTGRLTRRPRPARRPGSRSRRVHRRHGRGEQGQPLPQVLPRGVPGIQGSLREAPLRRRFSTSTPRSTDRLPGRPHCWSFASGCSACPPTPF